jgi:4-hydroxy-3-methylbut-2-enyl diphosphate reductase
LAEQAYFQKGFGLKTVIEGSLRRDYHSGIVQRLRESGFRVATPRVEIRLAEEFGFCYGVDRAVEYAYETMEKFPGRRVTLIGEIIHNPHVNMRLREMGIRILSPEDAAKDGERFQADDVVIIPAFGVPFKMFETLRATGCVLVDTTCGSVLNVWKNVEKYARDGFTSVIHGKYQHEETRATASRATRFAAGHYLVVKDMDEARLVCAYIRGTGDREAFVTAFSRAVSPGFDPDRHLESIGVANQTTMLSSESLAIAEALKQAIIDRHGADSLRARFRSFDTICSATQDRQDAVLKMTKEPLDLMLVIGGYNSSNTNHLVDIAGLTTRAFHIQNAGDLLGADRIRHKPAGTSEEIVTEGWLPEGRSVIGVTAGASTPNNKIGEVVEKILSLRGVALEEAGLA